jgi:hypothetical protein
MTRIHLAVFGFIASALPASASAEALIIAQLQPGTDAAVVAFEHGLVLRDVTPQAPFCLFAAPSSEGDDIAEADLRSDSRVVFAESDADMSSTEDQGLPRGKTSKGGSLSVIGGRDKLQNINSGALQQVHWTSSLANGPGRPVRIAILDTLSLG